MLGLLKSRKFWITIFDIVVATATYFVTKYVAPEIGEDVLWLIAAWQPVIIALITGIAVEDAAMKRYTGESLLEIVDDEPQG
jgi:hypothetical protein